MNGLQFAELMQQPFPVTDIEWRIQQCGVYNDKVWAQVLAYVSNRAIMSRLDEVTGDPSMWSNEFTQGPDGGVVCAISIYNPELGFWTTKRDGSENSDIEPVKGGLSGSMKRAAVQWGIGRYLYHLGVMYAEVLETKVAGARKGKVKGASRPFFWIPPRLPEWAIPKELVDTDAVTLAVGHAECLTTESIASYVALLATDPNVNDVTKDVIRVELRGIYKAKVDEGRKDQEMLKLEHDVKPVDIPFKEEGEGDG